MKKALFIIATLFISTAVEMRAEVADEISEYAITNEQTLVISGSNVTISGANGEVLEVFKITGELVYSVRVDSDSKNIKLSLPKGCYILRVGKTSRKVSIS